MSEDGFHMYVHVNTPLNVFISLVTDKSLCDRNVKNNFVQLLNPTQASVYDPLGICHS